MLLSKTIDFLLEHANVEVTDDIPTGEPVPEKADALEEAASDETEESANDNE